MKRFSCHAFVICGSVLMTLVSSSNSAAAQTLVYGDTIVEILGLRSWTPERLERAVQARRPGLTLASAACAVILRDSIGFADAAVITYQFPGRDTIWTAIRVVEPSDSRLVRYDRQVRTRIPMPDSWADLDSLFAKSPRMLSFFQDTEFLLGSADTVWGRPVPPEGLELRELLRRRRSAQDRSWALDLMRGSSDPNARQMAALIASNFADDEAVWHALVQALLAGSDHGASAAQMVYAAMARSGRFTIDWEPAIDVLTAIVGGTNLFAYDRVLIGLVDTGITPELARRLAAVNPSLMADHAVAQNRSVRLPIRTFLTHAGAPDLGMNRDAWLGWLTQR